MIIFLFFLFSKLPLRLHGAHYFGLYNGWRACGRVPLLSSPLWWYYYYFFFFSLSPCCRCGTLVVVLLLCNHNFLSLLLSPSLTSFHSCHSPGDLGYPFTPLLLVIVCIFENNNNNHFNVFVFALTAVDRKHFSKRPATKCDRCHIVFLKIELVCSLLLLSMSVDWMTDWRRVQ